MEFRGSVCYIYGGWVSEIECNVFSYVFVVSFHVCVFSVVFSLHTCLASASSALFPEFSSSSALLFSPLHSLHLCFSASLHLHLLLSLVDFVLKSSLWRCCFLCPSFVGHSFWFCSLQVTFCLPTCIWVITVLQLLLCLSSFSSYRSTYEESSDK